MRFSSFLLLATLVGAAAVAGACATSADLPWGATGTPTPTGSKTPTGTATTSGAPADTATPGVTPGPRTISTSTSFRGCSNVVGPGTTDSSFQINFSQFLPSEEVLLLEVQAATLPLPAPNYQTLTIAAVGTVGAQTVTFTKQPVIAYQPQALLEICRVFQFTRLVVESSGVLSAPAWDGTGGVLALRITTSLSIAAQGRIDMSGQGFRGGLPVTPLPVAAPPATCPFTEQPGDGEGVLLNGWNSGNPPIENGGGAGASWVSGGGGGANGTDAGTGAGGILPSSIPCVGSGGGTTALGVGGILALGGGGGAGFAHAVPTASLHRPPAGPSPSNSPTPTPNPSVPLPIPGGNGGGLLYLEVGAPGGPAVSLTSSGILAARGLDVPDGNGQDNPYFGGAGGGAGGTIVVVNLGTSSTINLPWMVDLHGGAGQGVRVLSGSAMAEIPGGGGGGTGGILVGPVLAVSTDLGGGLGGSGAGGSSTGGTGHTGFPRPLP